MSALSSGRTGAEILPMLLEKHIHAFEIIQCSEFINFVMNEVFFFFFHFMKTGFIFIQPNDLVALDECGFSIKEFRIWSYALTGGLLI